MAPITGIIAVVWADKAFNKFNKNKECFLDKFYVPLMFCAVIPGILAGLFSGGILWFYCFGIGV